MTCLRCDAEIKTTEEPSEGPGVMMGQESTSRCLICVAEALSVNTRDANGPIPRRTAPPSRTTPVERAGDNMPGGLEPREMLADHEALWGLPQVLGEHIHDLWTGPSRDTLTLPALAE